MYARGTPGVHDDYSVVDMYNRTIKLVRTLVGNEKMSSAELMGKLKISQRTLRAEIKEANELLGQQRVSIHSSSTGGYYLKNEDKAQAQKVLDQMIEESKRVVFPETPDERFLFGTAWLFFVHTPISIQKLAETLYVSKTAMLQTKKQIQDTLRWYHGLFLESGKNGMWISGAEKIKRHALAEILNYRTYGSILMERVITFLFGAEKYEDYISLYRQLPRILLKHDYRLIDKGIEGFALDIFISLMRTEQGFRTDHTGQQEPDAACMDDICGYLSELGYEAEHADRDYWKECLQSKRVLYTMGKHYGVPEEYLSVTEEFLKRVDERYHTGYCYNSELVSRLSVHIMKMTARIEQGYFEINPALEDIMSSYERYVEAADELNQILERRYSLTANIHEICYVAVYLHAYAAGRLKAIVLCDIGESIADNMMRRIADYCGERIELLDKMSLAEYRLNPLPVDLLISASRVYDVALPEQTRVIYVDYLLKEENLKNIQEYLLLDMQKEQTI